MSKPTVYGTAQSRALRAVWGIEEVGIDYDHVPTHFFEDSKTPEYLAINPNGRIPALVDGDVVLFESMAINLYLAKSYGGSLYPDNAPDEARAWQWSVWAISEIEPLQMQVVIQKFFVPEADRDQTVVDGAIESLQRPLKVLDAHLSKQDYLLGADFSVADINVVGVMLLFGMGDIGVSEHKNVQRWMDACYARPALARAQAKK